MDEQYVEPELLINRELSWLDFGSRLLDLAEDDSLVLAERIKFLALFAEGLDEFFQIRVSGLTVQVARGISTRSADGLRPTEALAAISDRAHILVARQNHIYNEQIAPELVNGLMGIVDWSDLDPDERERLGAYFSYTISPVLTPLAIDPGHPFPYISNLSLNLIVVVTNPADRVSKTARVKIPPFLPRYVPLADKLRAVPIEQIIGAHLGELFGSMEVSDYHLMRVTRDVDLPTGDGDDGDDLLTSIESELLRRRFGQAVRIEISEGWPDDLVDEVVAEVGVTKDSVYIVEGPVDMAGLRGLDVFVRPGFSNVPWTGRVPPALAGKSSIFDAISERDILVHHPYESFAASVERFIEEAAADDAVLAIKHTLYRAGDDSQIVDSLISASQTGKQVVAVVELQARFDEEANIAWARRLEEAGVQVVYGLGKFKTHSKISLVVRSEGSAVVRYCHIGSGNYNSQTAMSYEDVGLFTRDDAIGADVGRLFNYLTGTGEPDSLQKIVVSPSNTRRVLIEMIDRQTELGTGGLIRIKTNGLTDPAIIGALYRASQSGVRVDAAVRGVCCLRPGITGVSENITVRSVVGRFLEHSRIYTFGRGEDAVVLIGSPDLMERSLDRRIEVLVPIEDPALVARLMSILDLVWEDESNSWNLGGDGVWERVESGGEWRGFDAQAHFAALSAGEVVADRRQ